MALSPGWKAPDFTTGTTAGPIRFHNWGYGCWRIVLTHPGDYSTHSLRAGIRWARTGSPPVHLLGLSPVHGIMAGTSANPCGFPPLGLPVIHDETGQIAALWRGVTADIGPVGIPQDEHAVFIVDPTNTIRGTLTGPAAGGRDFAEVIGMARGLGVEQPPLNRARRAA